MQARRWDEAPCGAPGRESSAAEVWTAEAVRAEPVEVWTAAAVRVEAAAVWAAAAVRGAAAARVPEDTTPTRRTTSGNGRQEVRGERIMDERGQREEKQASYAERRLITIDYD